MTETCGDGSQKRCPGSQCCALWGRGSIILAMREVLSKTDDPKALLCDQEFYELSLLDEANNLGTRYCVRQAHAEWSEVDGQIMWDREETDHFWILNEAKQRYAQRRLALAQRGFVYSDMDLV
jgi:hypothetical protein